VTIKAGEWDMNTKGINIMASEDRREGRMHLIVAGGRTSCEHHHGQIPPSGVSKE
jgi:hypothetical protein